MRVLHPLFVHLHVKPAWMLYRGAALLKLVGMSNKLRTGAALLLNRVFERDLSIVSPGRGT